MNRNPFLLAVVFLGCATSRSSESQLQLSGKEETQTTAVEHREFQSTEHEGPWRVTRYYYGAPQEAKAKAPAGGLPDVQAAQGRPGEEGLRGPESAERAPEVATGGLVAVVVEDHFGRDITAQSSSDGLRGAETRVDVKADAEAHSASKTRLGLSLWAYAVIGLVLAALAAAAWKCKPPFLSFLWKLL